MIQRKYLIKIFDWHSTITWGMQYKEGQPRMKCKNMKRSWWVLEDKRAHSAPIRKMYRWWHIKWAGRGPHQRGWSHYLCLSRVVREKANTTAVQRRSRMMAVVFPRTQVSAKSLHSSRSVGKIINMWLAVKKTNSQNVWPRINSN